MGISSFPVLATPVQPFPSFGPAAGKIMTADEMEAAHKAEGLRTLQARKDQEAVLAEEAHLAEERTRAIHAELHARLQELATADAAVVLEFAEKNENIWRGRAKRWRKGYNLSSTTRQPHHRRPSPERMCHESYFFPLTSIQHHHLLWPPY